MKKRHKKIAQSQARTLTRLLKIGGKDRMKFPKQLLGGHRCLYTRAERSKIYEANGENYRDSYGFYHLLKNCSVEKKARIMRALFPTLTNHEMRENHHFRKNHGRLYRIYGGWYEVKITLVKILYGSPQLEQVNQESSLRIRKLAAWCERNKLELPAEMIDIDKM